MGDREQAENWGGRGCPSLQPPLKRTAVQSLEWQCDRGRRWQKH